ncbi:MAG: agmatinase [Spirochaetes bacterium GWF1_41_5]|nr:MAG: agmatinase [Spirochaetes bacterium GWF1_41_5]
MIILPVPFDVMSSWNKGADKGPGAIIDASSQLEFYNIETDSEVYKKGIFTDEPVISAAPEDMIEKVQKKISQYLADKKFPVILGGDHSVTNGIFPALFGKYPDCSILHLDAHADTRDEYEGSKYSHASVMARARTYTSSIISAGIRSMEENERRNILPKNLFLSNRIHKSRNWIKKIIKRLNRRVYITIDVDVFDSSFMPSTGTPEPGGLTWLQVDELLQAVACKKDIVGFDAVELCPSQNKAPDFAVAKLIYNLLSYKFYSKNL